MTLHATCPTNGAEIDFGFTVYAERTERPLPRGETRGFKLPTGDIQVEVSECPACGRVHWFVTAPVR
jgi:hypothetical protein